MRALTFTFLVLLNLNSYHTLGQSKANDEADIKYKTVEVVLGIDKIMKLDFVPDARVNLGGGCESVLTFNIIPQRKEIILKGIKPGGPCTVNVRDTARDFEPRGNYLVTVTQTAQSKVVKILKEFLGDIEGIEIGIKGGSVYVGGKIIVPSDIGKIVLILEKYPDVLRLVELSPQTQIEIAKRMQNEIQNAQMKDVTVRVVNSLYWLEGIVSKADDRNRAQLIAQVYVPDIIENLARRTNSVRKAKKAIIQNFIQVNVAKKPPSIPKLLKISAQFIELSKDYNKVFSFHWNPILAGDGGTISFGKRSDGGVTTKASGTLSGTISNLFPKLNSAKSAGYARVIQSGVVIVNENENANINKTSTKRFVLGTGESEKTEQAVAGFRLKIVKPKILPGEKIRMSLELSVNSTIGDPPEEISNSVNTSVMVKAGDTAVIGGVVTDKSATGFDRDPPNGVPTVENAVPLFSFLRSKSYIKSKGQFAIFVTPEIIVSASEGTEKIKRKFRRRAR